MPPESEQERPKCGSTDTKTGQPCENPAGYGTDSDIGPCYLHPSEGRPSKFTDEAARSAVQAAREAKSISGCARAAGVHRDTLVNWLQKRPQYQTQNGEYEGFFVAFMRARSEGESLLTRGPLTRPDEVDGAHARFLLKTSYGYQETDRLEVSDVSGDEDSVGELREILGDGF